MHPRFQAALTTLAADLQAAIAPMLADPHFPALLEAGGFTIGQLETSYLKGPRPMTWVYRGWAE